jgi:hypothetical protein
MSNELEKRGGSRIGAGRPPGRLSDIALLARAEMEEHGYNPIQALMEIAEDDDTPLKLRVDAHKELLKYYAPQLKAVDVNATTKQGVTVNIVNFANRLKSCEGVTSEKGAYVAANKLKSLDQEQVRNVSAEIIDAEVIDE